jgi:hypothetical protein
MNIKFTKRPTLLLCGLGIIILCAWIISVISVVTALDYRRVKGGSGGVEVVLYNIAYGMSLLNVIAGVLKINLTKSRVAYGVFLVLSCLNFFTKFGFFSLSLTSNAGSHRWKETISTLFLTPAGIPFACDLCLLWIMVMSLNQQSSE